MMASDARAEAFTVVTPLSRTIQSVEQVASMETAELETSLAAHEWEIVRIVGALQQGGDPRWSARARQAQRVLQLHKSWIARELTQRRSAEAKKAAARERQARAEAHKQLLAKSHAEKVERIAASNDENMQQLAVFKAVAREVLGAEQYLNLWTLVRLRIQSHGHAGVTDAGASSENAEGMPASSGQNEPEAVAAALRQRIGRE